MTHSTKALSVRSSLWLGALFAVALLAIYAETVMSMVSIWSRSDTFAHGFLILPISLWLVWNKRDYLKYIAPSPAPWVALLILPAGFAWFLAWLVDVLLVQQLALVTMLVAGLWAVLGHRLAGVLAFPLFFLYFAVPMGEGLVAPMMDFTAVSTVWLVQQTGIPVYREGLFFTLPTGRWSIVEACSGVRYIIASVTVGALFAYLTYVSWWRRALFLLISAIVPVFANTLRAYMIVMLGHLSDMKVATGADHLVYGWVFFGVVIFILFWLGSFFREDEAPLPEEPRAGTGATTAAAGMTAGIVSLCLVLVLAAAAPLVARWV
ncbi:MAG: exosortase A, partial [Halioglobus sp.]|nr:exosortase A [Halioglobus sp.]